MDALLFDTDWYITKFKDPGNEIAKRIKAGDITVDDAKMLYADRFLGVEHHHGNLATTEGIKYLIWAMCGVIDNVEAPASTAKFDSSNARLVVGTGSGAPTQNNTYATFTNPVVKAMDAGYPKCSPTSPWTVTWRATYAAGEASQAWNEFGLINTSDGKILFDRVVVNKGTKDEGETWVIELNIAMS